jgi:hypothetical protein
MRSEYSQKIEAGRVVAGHYASRRGDACGAFLVRGPSGRQLAIIVSDGLDDDPALAGWEHVSVSIEGKHPPNWQEMSWVKNAFWDDTETVVQLHPKLSQYINIHPNCLHLWRQVGIDAPLPPPLLV